VAKNLHRREFSVISNDLAGDHQLQRAAFSQQDRPVDGKNQTRSGLQVGSALKRDPFAAHIYRGSDSALDDQPVLHDLIAEGQIDDITAVKAPIVARFSAYLGTEWTGGRTLHAPFSHFRLPASSLCSIFRTDYTYAPRDYYDTISKNEREINDNDPFSEQHWPL
jgi:hypothetical protein